MTPVVLLHGQPDTRATWLGVLRRLGSDGVLAPDRPGYGVNPLGPADYPGNVDWLISYLDQHGIAEAVVAGHSWGGGVATLAAARHPDRVAGLALVAPVGPRCLLPWDRLLAAPGLGEAIAWAGVKAGGRAARAKRLADYRRLFDPADLPEAEAELDAQLARPVWRSFLVEQRALIRQLPVLDAALPAISCPVRIIAGDEDTVIPRRTVEAMAAVLPQAEVELVHGGQHDLPLHHPDRVAAVIASVRAEAG